MSYTIIDRRLNPGGKNLSNRQRFVRRATEQLKKSVKEGFSDRSIVSNDDQSVSIPEDGIHEPWFRNDHETGKKEFILPGNKDFVPGDLIDKPKKGKGKGKKASDDGEGEDDFTFSISKDEYYDILFEGLELPELKKKGKKDITNTVRVRSGFVNEGNPSSLDLERSLRNSLGRRIALKKPKLKLIEQLESELNFLKNQHYITSHEKLRILDVEEEIERLRRKSNAVLYLEPLDLKFRHFEKRPLPRHQAVMFCVMDVSGSMGEHEKDLAKRFYLLLYLFLTYKYEKVDVVFIRHHTAAKECNEEEFFHAKDSGGTVVSTGFELASKILKERYDTSMWNIYFAQASDGDNFENDNERLEQILTNDILPVTQYFAYLEVGPNDHSGQTEGRDDYGIWSVYKQIRDSFSNMALKKVTDPVHVYSVFREFFKKETQ